MNPKISRACAKELKIKYDSLEAVNPLIEIPNAAPVLGKLLDTTIEIPNYELHSSRVLQIK